MRFFLQGAVLSTICAAILSEGCYGPPGSSASSSPATATDDSFTPPAGAVLIRVNVDH